MLDIIMQLDISASNNNHLPSHEKNITKKKKKRRKIQKIWGDWTKTHMLTKTIHR